MGNPEPNPVLRKPKRMVQKARIKKRIGAETQWELF